MKPTINSFRLLLAISLLAMPALLLAQSTGHYVAGTEGIKGASLPPPGWYVRDYNLFYTSGRLNDVKGNRIKLVDPDIFVYANVPRLIWITDVKVLGGSLGFDALVPLVHQNVEINSPLGHFEDGSFGIGDAFAESTLSWHLPHFDFSLGAGVWAATGNSSPPPKTDPGAGFWASMLTAGATWYIDSEKTWSLSALSRYEFNGKQRDTDIYPGQAYTLEWGVAKTFAKTIDVGVVGYVQRQTTSGNVTGSQKLGSAAGIGPEISLAFPKPMLSVSLRYLRDFSAKDRAEGQTFSLTLTKRF